MAKESSNNKHVISKSLQISRKFYLTCARSNNQLVLGYLEKNIIQILNIFQTVLFFRKGRNPE